MSAAETEPHVPARPAAGLVNANLSGSVVDLPAGPLGVAIGAEYRREASSENWDALTNVGGTSATPFPTSAASSTSRKPMLRSTFRSSRTWPSRSSSTCAPRAVCRIIRRSVAPRRGTSAAITRRSTTSASGRPTRSRSVLRTSANCSRALPRPSRPASWIRASASRSPTRVRPWVTSALPIRAFS